MEFCSTTYLLLQTHGLYIIRGEDIPGKCQVSISRYQTNFILIKKSFMNLLKNVERCRNRSHSSYDEIMANHEKEMPKTDR